MNFLKTSPAVTALFAAIALGSTGLAAASDSGLSDNERSAQQVIVNSPLPSRVGSNNDLRVATLAHNEHAAQSVIAGDFTAGGTQPSTLEDVAATLAANERAARRAIVDAPVDRTTIASADSHAAITTADHAGPVVAQ